MTEPLYLTEENKQTIRALVLLLTRADAWPKPQKEAPSYTDFQAELATVTRRAFTPNLIAQIYNSSPLITATFDQMDERSCRPYEWIAMDAPQSHAEMAAEEKRIAGERQKAHKAMLRKLDAERLKRKWRGKE